MYTAAENIIKQLGSPLNASAYAHNGTASTSTHHRQGSNSGDQSGRQTGKTPTKPVKVDKARLTSLVHELQDTEKRYLKRIACLKNVSDEASFSRWLHAVDPIDRNPCVFSLMRTLYANSQDGPKR